MIKRLVITGIALINAHLLFSSLAFAQSSCSATNSNNDMRCSITCPAGQTASCSDATGSTPPDCHCSVNPSVQASNNHGTNAITVELAAGPTSPSQVTPIQNTNLLEVIDSKLAGLANHNLSKTCHLEIKQAAISFGGPSFQLVCQIVVGKLSVQSPLIISAGPTVTLGEPNWDDIPSDIFRQHTSYKNCSSVQQTETFQHSVTLSVGDQVTKSKTLTTGSTQQIQLSGSFAIGIKDVGTGTFGGNTTFSISTSASITDTGAESHTETKQDSVSLPLAVPPMTELRENHAFIQYKVPIPFHGTVTVDAQLARNLDGITLLSSVLPDPVDRTFEFSGVVINNTLIDTKTETTERQLTATDCVGTEKNNISTSTVPQ
jgi:hypothetical protein